MNCNQNCVRPMENKELSMVGKWATAREGRGGREGGRKEERRRGLTRERFGGEDREGRPDERRTRSIDGGGQGGERGGGRPESRFTVGEGRKWWDAGRNGGGIAGERRSRLCGQRVASGEIRIQLVLHCGSN